MRVNWTEAEVELLHKLVNYCKIKDIAFYMDRSIRSVGSQMTKQSLSTVKPFVCSEGLGKKIADLLINGYTKYEIMEILSISRRVMTEEFEKYCKKSKVKLKPYPQSLTEDEIMQSLDLKYIAEDLVGIELEMYNQLTSVA